MLHAIRKVTRNNRALRHIHVNKVCNAEQYECYLQSKTKGAVIYNYTVRQSLISAWFFGNNLFLSCSRHRQVPVESFPKLFVTKKVYATYSCTNYFSFPLFQYSKKATKIFLPNHVFICFPHLIAQSVTEDSKNCTCIARRFIVCFKNESMQVS
jgi:hypothetical protein